MTGHVRDFDARLVTINGEPPATIGTAGAVLNEEVRCQVYGMASVSVVFTPSPATYAFEASSNGGVAFDLPVRMENVSLGTTGTTGPGVFNYEGGLPAGATHFRVRCSVASTASTITVLPSAAPFRVQMTVGIASGAQVTLLGTGNRVGNVGSGGVQNDETTTQLGISGTFVGASRDLTTTASGSNAVATTNFKEFRGFSFADVAGTLFLATSQDNITFRRVLTVAAVLASGVYSAIFTYAPVLRYARVEYDNGVTGQAYFVAATTRMAV